MPEIIIEYNRFLDPVFIAFVHTLPNWKDWEPPTQEEVLRRVENYKAEWQKYGPRILNGLTGITGLGFNRDVIDVYIVSGNSRQFSNPIVIKSGFEPAEFVDVLTHELIHRLFVLNKLKKGQIVPEEYVNETDLVKNHILLHALLQYIYLEVLQEPDRLESNLKRSENHGTNDYVRAWEIVRKEGYKEIINKFLEKMRA